MAEWLGCYLDLKPGNPKFTSRSDHQLNLLQVIPGSTPRLHLNIANWYASCQLGFLTCSVHVLYSVCTAGSHQPMAANYYQPTHYYYYYYDMTNFQHRLIPGNESSSQVSMQNFRVPTPFLGYAPIQGEQTFALFFSCLGFPVSSYSPSISLTWNKKSQPPLAHCFLPKC